ncbi:class I SAM-dependent methyltransferase [Candidatus Poribacteria bacterium]|nr:class I SAM-dependent methyltransferase [Candidatus Poribacteria bacterium]
MKDNQFKDRTYKDWNKFIKNEIPSSLDIFPILYENIKHGDKIVDIGCGYGKTCFQLAFANYGPILGFDINISAIQYANEYLKKLSENIKSNLRFEVHDALCTQLNTDTFDVGIMQAFLTTLTTPEDRQKAMNEARRIIKRGGSLYLAVFIQTWHSEKYFVRYLKGIEETGEEGSFYVRNKETGQVEYQAHHYTEKEIILLLKNAGFSCSYFNYENFVSRSGNLVNGAVIWAN